MANKLGKQMPARSQDRLRMLLHGEPGSGKTTKATSIALECKTLYVYVLGEPGTTSIPKEYRKNLSMEKVTSYDDVADLFWQLQMDDHDFEAVVFEGASPLQSLFLREQKNYAMEGGKQGMARQRSKAAPNTDIRRLYQPVVSLLSDTMIYWYGLADGERDNPLNIIFTSQTRYRRKDEEDESEDPKWRPDVSPGAWNAVEANPDFIGYCYTEESLDNLSEEVLRYPVRFQGTEQILAKMHSPLERSQQIVKKYPGGVFGKDGSEITIPKLARAFGVRLKG